MIIPVFPLNIVAFPKMPLPLHIFEDRYKSMINYCLNNNKVFGIISNHNNHLNKTGCTMVISKVFHEYGDGRKDILTVGERRFYIKSLDYSDVYLKADIEFFDDVEPDEINTKKINKLIDETLELYRGYLKKLNPEKAENYHVFFEQPYQQVSFRMAAAIHNELHLKQKLLEEVSEEKRLEELKIYFMTKTNNNSDSTHPLIKQLQENHNFSNN